MSKLPDFIESGVKLLGKTFNYLITNIHIGTLNFDSTPESVVLMRWDTFTDLAKWALSIAALVCAGLSIDAYSKLPFENSCAASIDLKNLYVTFISFVIILFSLTIVSPYQLSILFEFIIRWLLPPTLIALTAYLVYITNKLAHLSAKQLIDTDPPPLTNDK
jgi:hypothetical protein